ncbi:MAG: ribonuclease HIII [Parachlamydiaceae bacterium]|nr:ribonuclease HIII [Parachlamydiaceae bacterium]
MSESTNFVTTIDVKLESQMVTDLESQGFTISKPPYTLFSAKKKGISCTLYSSGKLVVQGKEKAEFIEFYLEPILQTFTYSYPKIQAEMSVDKAINTRSSGVKVSEQESSIKSRIGIDESGKGDFFGPLCIAGVYATSQSALELKAMGVKDSKDLNDLAILKLAKIIRANYVHHIVKINPQKYNELYAQFKNLNYLLAWGHATTIEQLVTRTGCRNIVVDQFANERVVLTALKRKNLELDVFQRHRAEEDLVVAAASILAREAFLLGLQMLGEEFSIKLPKGASSATIEAGKLFVRRYGIDALGQVGKLHFKTLNSIQ